MYLERELPVGIHVDDNDHSACGFCCKYLDRSLGKCTHYEIYLEVGDRARKFRYPQCSDDFRSPEDEDTKPLSVIERKK